MPVTSHAIAVGGVKRRVLVAEPTGAATAVVLCLHGSGSTPERQMRLSRMFAFAQRDVVVAFPQGSIPSRRGSEWDLAGDIDYLDAVVDHLRTAFAAHSAALCVSGMSGGARMASRFSSTGRNPVDLLAAIAGLRLPAVERLGRPVRVLAFHGTRDRINPYGGGDTDRWRESVLEAASGWAHANGHASDPIHSDPTPSLRRLDYGPPGDPGAVTLWVCDRAGHTWPGTRLSPLLRLFLGRVCHDVDATREIWRAVSGAERAGAQ